MQGLGFFLFIDDLYWLNHQKHVSAWDKIRHNKKVKNAIEKQKSGSKNSRHPFSSCVGAETCENAGYSDDQPKDQRHRISSIESFRTWEKYVRRLERQDRL